MTLSARLDELRTLEPGWLDGEGLPPTPAALATALGMARYRRASGWPDPHVYPTSEGGLQLEWGLDDALPGASVEIDVLPGGGCWWRLGETTALLSSLPTETPDRTLHFHDLEFVFVSPGASGGYVAHFLDPLTEGTGATRAGALAALGAALWRDSWDLNGRHTGDLAPEQRKRKQLLLGAVDLAESDLLRGVREHTWISGEVRHGTDGVLRFVRDSDGCFYALTPELLARFEAGELPREAHYLARTRTDKAGRPVEPVDAVGEPLGLDPDAAWKWWAEREATP